MIHNFTHKRDSKNRVKILFVFLYAGLFSMMSTQANSHPDKLNNDLVTERAEQRKNKHEQMRQKAQERASVMRREAAERREIQKQKSIKRRAESDEEKAKHLSFKAQLISMLWSDGVITTKNEVINISYFGGDPIANDINLSEQFGDKYKTLWGEHNRIISEQSYLNIMPGSYEIREITEDGMSRHLTMQTN